ncbi:hypothetical protein G6F61_002327 [Rhizopus arrhizus]|nr:hypothetical protein G6F61_002327 [Rhizopus arrhizus]
MPGPPSPTHSFVSSFSWMAEKTSSELIPMLKNAYHTLKDKEKDLLLAAELGKSLLEHNLQLKSSYDSLLQKATTPPISPSSSTSSKLTDKDDMRFIPSHTACEAMINVLEKKNAELTRKIELTVKAQEQLKNPKKIKRLKDEICFLKSQLDIASTKIQELQDMRSRQKHRKVRQEPEKEEDWIETLYETLDRKREEKESVHRSKLELESKLAVTLKDLCELKRQYESFQFTLQDFEQLQMAYERQRAHVEELKGSLEEHRVIVQRLNGEHDSMPFVHNVSLLSELEFHWLKSPSLILSKVTGLDQQVIDEAFDFMNQIEASSQSASSYSHRASSQSASSYLSSAHFSVLSSPEDSYPTLDLYPHLPTSPCFLELEPLNFIERLKNHIQKLFNLVWKWCRFSMVLTTVLVISAWQGP